MTRAVESLSCREIKHQKQAKADKAATRRTALPEAWLYPHIGR